MYRYAQTKNRVHRVIVEGGKAFQVEQCNLDDAAYTRLEDIAPDGTRCAYCWRGWVEPTDEAKAKHADEIKQFTEQPDAKTVPLVQATRRLALVALASAALLGTAVGVVASPDLDSPVPTADTDVADRLGELGGRIDELFLQIRVLQVDITGHTHEQDPTVIVLPTAAPPDEPVEPVDPTADPTAAPSAASDQGSTTTITREEVVRVVVVPVPDSAPVSSTPPPPTPAPTTAPTPTPAPTAAPTSPPTPAPTPCSRPGVANGADPCKWPWKP